MARSPKGQNREGVLHPQAYDVFQNCLWNTSPSDGHPGWGWICQCVNDSGLACRTQTKGSSMNYLDTLLSVVCLLTCMKKRTNYNNERRNDETQFKGFYFLKCIIRSREFTIWSGFLHQEKELIWLLFLNHFMRIYFCQVFCIKVFWCEYYFFWSFDVFSTAKLTDFLIVLFLDK
jgi:hypothetical protein